MSGHVWLDSWSLAVSPLPQKQPQSVKQTPTTTHYHSLPLSGKSCFHQNIGLLPFHDIYHGSYISFFSVRYTLDRWIINQCGKAKQETLGNSSISPTIGHTSMEILLAYP